MLACGVGEVLWDIFDDHEEFGGAALNFCANLQRLGDEAILFSAVGNDAHGRMALQRMRSLGLSVDGVNVVGHLPTGIANVTTGLDKEPTFVIKRPAAFDALSTVKDSTLLARLKQGGARWIYYGTLLQTQPEVESFTRNLLRDLSPARGFYDINLRPGHWNLALVQRLSDLASVVKLNEAEAETLFSLTRHKETPFSLEDFCHTWASTHAVDVICVTLGSAGCLIYHQGSTVRVPGYPATVRDTVGAGDAFAAAFLHAYDRGWPIAQAADFANAVGALIASRAGATPHWEIDEVFAITKSALRTNAT